MSTITFDTLKFAKTLEASGVPAPQAAAEAEAIQNALGESSLATQQDIVELRHELREARTEINGKVVLVQWMLGVLLALAVANFAKQFF